MAATPERNGCNRALQKSPRKRRLEEMQDKAKEALTCAVCLELIVPPVQQCTEGHPICDACFAALPCGNNRKRCPTCRTEYLGKRLRSLIADQMAQYIDYPCPFKARGCTEVLPLSELNNHAKQCRHNPEIICCPLGTCNWTGLASEFQAHIEDASKPVMNQQRTLNASCWMEHSNAYTMMGKASKSGASIRGTQELLLDGYTAQSSSIGGGGPHFLFFKGLSFLAFARQTGDKLNMGMCRLTPLKQAEAELNFKISVDSPARKSGLMMWGSVSNLGSCLEDIFEDLTCLSIKMTTARALSCQKLSCFNHLSDIVNVEYSIYKR